MMTVFLRIMGVRKRSRKVTCCPAPASPGPLISGITTSRSTWVGVQGVSINFNLFFNVLIKSLHLVDPHDAPEGGAALVQPARGQQPLGRLVHEHHRQAAGGDIVIIIAGVDIVTIFSIILT